MADKIYVRDLAIDCIIGIEPKERIAKQTVVINLVLTADLAPAAQSDRIEDTVDYKDLKNRLLDDIGASDFLLIERMAEHIAAMCLSDSRVTRATVTVDKPGALTGARSVAVEITRP